MNFLTEMAHSMPLTVKENRFTQSLLSIIAETWNKEKISEASRGREKVTYKRWGKRISLTTLKVISNQRSAFKMVKKNYFNPELSIQPNYQLSARIKQRYFQSYKISKFTSHAPSSGSFWKPCFTKPGE